MTFCHLESEIENILSDLDVQTGLVIKEENETININENMQMPAASVIKIPIIIEAFRKADNGELNLSETMTIPADAVVGGSGVLQSLSEHISMSLLDILTLMIVVSDNTASNLALERIGIENVNRFCQQMGCQNTEIQRYFMDMNAAEAGLNNVTTADDMIKILEEITSPRLLTKKSADRVFEIMTAQQLNLKLPAYQINDDMVIANKTGELARADHDVGIFQYNDRKVFAAVLMNDVSDHVAAQQAIARVGKAIMMYLTA